MTEADCRRCGPERAEAALYYVRPGGYRFTRVVIRRAQDDPFV